MLNLAELANEDATHPDGHGLYTAEVLDVIYELHVQLLSCQQFFYKSNMLSDSVLHKFQFLVRCRPA